MSQLDSVRDIAANVYQQAGIKEININGNRYSIQLLPAFTGFAIGLELTKLIIPAFGSYLDSEKKSEYVLPDEDTMFSEIALLLTSQMDKVNLVEIVQNLMSGLTCNGQQVDANIHFRGNISGFLKVIEYALKENFGDFFTDYLKEKGLKIRSLGEMMNQTQPEEEQKKSD